MSAEVETIAPKFVATVLAKGGRHMTHLKAVRKYGIVEVLSALGPGTQPSATVGSPYCKLVEERIRELIRKELKIDDIDVNTLEYPLYQTDLGHYSNPTLLKLFLYGIDQGLPEDFYKDIFPTTMEIVQDKKPSAPLTRPNPVDRAPVLQRDLKPRDEEVVVYVRTFDDCYNSIPPNRTLNSLEDLWTFKYINDPDVHPHKFGEVWRMQAGTVRYLLIRGQSGGLLINEFGVVNQLDIGLLHEQVAAWVIVGMAEMIHDCILKGDDLTLMLAVADLHITDCVQDSYINAVVKALIAEYNWK
jgi:hypothetical protein